jgi:single-strand DNA-binding protein
MFNQVQLIGNLGADPEIRTLNDGARVVNLRLATQEKWRDRTSGETRQKTEWHRVTVWGEGAAKYLEYAQKGTLIQVMGKLETRKWTDQAGEDRYSTEVVVNFKGGGRVQILSGGVDRNEQPQQEEPRTQTRTRRGRNKPQEQTQNFSADLDDEIPF